MKRTPIGRFAFHVNADATIMAAFGAIISNAVTWEQAIYVLAGGSAATALRAITARR